MHTLLIDLREEAELLENGLESMSDDLQILHIPSRVLFANVIEINRQLNAGQVSQVWLVCQSGRRSSRAKTLYFPDDDRVVSVAGGVEAVIGQFPHQVKHVKAISARYGMQQYMQLMFAMLLFLLSSAIQMELLSLDSVRIVTMALAGLIFLQVSLKQCWLSLIVPWPEKLQPLDLHQKCA